jgi:plasmid rolling circle replication initiator protein Rep
MKLTGAPTPVRAVYQTGQNRANKHDSTDDNDTLTAYSPHDKPWDIHKGQSDDVAAIYRQDQTFRRLAERINGCSGQLLFSRNTNQETGESTLKLRGARFCRVRNCPVCQWRRSLMWRARFFQALPQLQSEHPTARWLFATFTVRNCPITDLRATLADMNRAWNRLILRPEFSAVTGWIRTTEVTRGKDGSCHPHFHCLLMVAPSYFNGRCYVTQNRWRELWQSVMRLDYPPVIDIRTVKGNGDGIHKAVCETLKYSVKPSDMTDDPAWFLEYTRQTHKLRFIATGGVLKKILKADKPETNEDLLLGDTPADTPETDEPLLRFDWNKSTRKYRRQRD